MAKRKDALQLQFVTDLEGNKTGVILSLELFESMIDALEELEDYYFEHNPQAEELEIDLTPFDYRKKKKAKQKLTPQ